MARLRLSRTRTANTRRATMLRSALLNVMVKAAHKASRRLKRDFGESSTCRSRSRAGQFRHRRRPADRGDPARGAGARASGLRFPRRGRRRTGKRRQDPPLDRRSGRRHAELSARHSTFCDLDRARAGRHHRRGHRLQSRQRRAFHRRTGKGAFLNDQRLRVAGRKRLADAVVACALPHPSRGDVELARSEHVAVQDKVAGMRRSGRPRSTSPGSRPGVSTPIGSATCRPGTWRPGSRWYARPAASDRPGRARRHAQDRRHPGR